MPPGLFEAERELAAGTGQEYVAVPRGHFLVAAGNPGCTGHTDASDLEMPLRPRDLGASVHGVNSLARNHRDGEFSKHTRLHAAPEEMLSSNLDTHRVELQGDEVGPEVEPLSWRNTVCRDRDHLSPSVETPVAQERAGCAAMR